MKSNKMIGTLAIGAGAGAAAYLLRNKDSRTKIMNQLQTLSTPENIEKLKSQFQTLSEKKPKVLERITRKRNSRNSKQNLDSETTIECADEPIAESPVVESVQ